MIETVEKDIAVEESESGLNDAIFGCILKMKEKERLKLVILLVNFNVYSIKDNIFQMTKSEEVEHEADLAKAEPLLGPKMKYRPQKEKEEDQSCAEVTAKIELQLGLDLPNSKLLLKPKPPKTFAFNFIFYPISLPETSQIYLFLEGGGLKTISVTQGT